VKGQELLQFPIGLECIRGKLIERTDRPSTLCGKQLLDRQAWTGRRLAASLSALDVLTGATLLSASHVRRISFVTLDTPIKARQTMSPFAADVSPPLLAMFTHSNKMSGYERRGRGPVRGPSHRANGAITAFSGADPWYPCS
jgi:hypothetical protein